MAKITRALQKIFGGSLSASGNIAEFGSLAAGSPAYSLDPAVIQSTRYLQAWAAATVGNSSPALQDRNALDFLFSRQLAYLYQTGLAEWDATTTYFTGSWVQDGAGNAYISKVDDNLNNALSDTNSWESLADRLASSVNGSQLCRAWVIFEGGTGAIYDSFNVSGVTRNAVGNYTINFDTALPNASYVFQLSSEQDDQVVETCQATRYNPDIYTASAFQMRNLNSKTSAGVDSHKVCASFFCNP